MREGRTCFLVLEGVDSAVEVYIDGAFLGFSKDSRLPAEFDLSQHCPDAGKEYTLSLKVYRFCDGSYMEDQDHWWLSGIYRGVELKIFEKR